MKQAKFDYYTAKSISASFKIIFGLFPPNSRLILFKFYVEFYKISFPTAVDPVNAILSIS